MGLKLWGRKVMFKFLLNKVLKMEALKGKRSYIMATGAGFAVGLYMLGIIDEATQKVMLEAFAVGWAFTMRAAVK